MSTSTPIDSIGLHVRLKLSLSILFLFTALFGNTQTLTEEFIDEGYTITDLESVPGVPTNYGGLTIKPEEPNTLYIGGAANGASGALYSIGLIRDTETNHITGFSGTAELVVAAPNVDGGVTFAPNGTFLFTRYSQNELGQVLTDDTYISTDLDPFGIASSVGSLMFVPTGFTAAGSLIIASYNGATLYNVPYTISETGEYLLSEQTASVSVAGTASGPEGIAFIPQGSDGFPNPSMVVSSYGSGKVVAFDVDDSGLPIAETARDMITELSGAEGALIDPATGDFLFSTFGGGNRVIVMSGFENPNDCAGVPFGESILDDCGVCRLPDDPEFNSTCLDCAGVPNGSAFLDDCGECVGGDTGEEACVFDCQDLLANFGDSCDDGDIMTENDVITVDCLCVGTPIYDCPDQMANIGDACDDGNEFTENDMVGANCECAGEVIAQENNSIACADGIDNDGDGLTDCEDPECQALSAGCSTCFNDGSSFADAVLDYENTCPNNIYTDPSEALGVPDFNVNGEANHSTLGEGGHITLAFTDNTLVNSGNSDPDLFVFEVGPLVEASTIELRPLNASTETLLIAAGLVDLDDDGFYEFGAITGATAVVDIDSFFDDAPAGTLFFDAIKITDIPGGCSGASPGADIDGVCALSSVPCAVGSPCDDGDDMTENDTINDDCECEGTPIVFDCPDLMANIGESCDDGDDTTENDLIDGDCNCMGTSIYDCPVLEANISDTCDDNNEMTENDAINEDCECMGTPIIVYDCPDLMANVGDECDDNDPSTDNDIIYADCNCMGTSVYDCPDLAANIGDVCDDGDDMTENDMINQDCECMGTPVEIYDCPDLMANVGDECDDDDPSTDNDIIDADCNCMGTSVYDCPDLAANIGDVCDDGNDMTENDMINEDCECMGTPVEIYDCPDLMANVGDECDDGNDDLIPGIVNENCECMAQFECPALGANIGDTCDDGNPDTENDMVNASCNCVGTPITVSDCQDYVMYLNNNLGGVTDIYSVNISSGDADLTYIATVDYQAHIAYNPSDNLIYVVHNGNASYVTVNPHTVVPEITAPVFLSMDVASVTTAAFAPNGKLLIGTMTEDKIYSVNITNQMVSLFDGYAPINGGDIAFDDTGMLYLATRSGNGFYEVYPDDVLADQLIGNIPSLVTGIALTESDQMIMSFKANSALQLRNLDGSDALVSYPLMLDGEAYAHADGDMTSGCNTYENPILVYCEQFTTYYMHHGPGVSGGQLYEVSFSGATANLTHLANVDFNAHIAYSGISQLVFLVNPNGSFIRVYDPATDEFLGQLPIIGELSNLVAAVYNPVDNKLYVGDATLDEIYAIDLFTGVATYFADAPVNGGDLAIQDGMLFLATREGDKLYRIEDGGAIEIGNIPSDVNGMAQSDDATDVIIANYNANVFTRILVEDALIVSTYNIMLNGIPFTTLNGDLAAACVEVQVLPDPESPATQDIEISTINAYPNPTNGISTVVFETTTTGRATLEVHDMNGRSVAVLYNEVAQAGLEYRLNFYGSNLPNGVYIYKLTTNNETIIEKFMIAR